MRFIHLTIPISVALAGMLVSGCAGVKHSSIPQFPELRAVNSPSAQRQMSPAETPSSPKAAAPQAKDPSREEAPPAPDLPAAPLPPQVREWQRPSLSPNTSAIAKASAYLREKGRKSDAKSRGIRYYASAPYVFVYSDLKGRVAWELHYLPDTTRLLTAKPYSFLAKNEFTMTFNTNGVLSQTIEKPDTTVIPTAVAAAVKEIAPMLVKALGAGVLDSPTVSTAPAVLAFRLHIDEQGNARLVGGSTDVATFNLNPGTGEKAPPVNGQGADGSK